MRFLVFGTGGVGGFFGAKLAHAGEDVWFIARGKHLEALKAEGLHIKSTAGDFTIPSGKMTHDLSHVGTADVVLFCVKSYDTERAARQIASILHENSIVLCLQNGVNNEEKIERIITRGTVYGGVAYISARITAPGVITESGGFQRIVFGPLRGPIGDRALQIQRSFVQAGVKCDVRDDVVKEIWKKYIFIASMGSFTALSRLTQGEILANRHTLALVFDAMREVQEIAWKLGVDVEPLDEAKVTEGLKRFDSDTRSSLYYDLVNEKPMEIEALNGNVVQLGQELGVPTPIHRVIYTTLLPYHLKHVEKLSAQAQV
ncbi:MAG: ketopantoate reductase family protein [Bacteroidota bacterium]